MSGTESKPPKPLTPDEVKALALRIFRNEIWWSYGLTTEQIKMSFMILSFLDAETAAYLKRYKVTSMWEERSQHVSSFAVNGMPMFMSCHMLYGKDTKRVLHEVIRLQQMTGVKPPTKE